MANCALGYWYKDDDAQLMSLDSLSECLHRLDVPCYLVEKGGLQVEVALGGQVHLCQQDRQQDTSGYRLLGMALPQAMDRLGDPSFCRDYNIKYPYMAGSMANGIASVELVAALANIGLLASFGAAGLSLPEIEAGVTRLQDLLGDKTCCYNLIYSPNELGHEDAVVDLYLKHGVTLVETSAYMKLTLPVVRYRVTGIHEDDQGKVIAPHRIIAKASRVELASKWFSPPPKPLLQELVQQGAITAQQAELANRIPMAQDVTVEADSGGHTDNRPLMTLLPAILLLRDQQQTAHDYSCTLRVGAAGGISTPLSALGAYSMGAAYVVTGSVNQACKESGSSDRVRGMLAQAEQTDVVMAPAVDMFEMGVKLQVLRRGTMFAMRGNKLYDLYKEYASIEEIPESERVKLENTIFKASMSDIWDKHVQPFFAQRDATQLDKAAHDSKHKMALIFRWYLGLSSEWANAGTEDRQIDYQIWCGPAMGAFNEWSRDTFLATPENRDVATVAMNILFGAAVLYRMQMLQNQYVHLPDHVIQYKPLPIAEIDSYLAG